MIISPISSGTQIKIADISTRNRNETYLEIETRLLFDVKLSITMVIFYLNEGKKISKLETKYSKKTKIREIIFDAYFDGNLDMESVITQLSISQSQFFKTLNPRKYCVRLAM
jgi:hypothetical protein